MGATEYVRPPVPSLTPRSGAPLSLQLPCQGSCLCMRLCLWRSAAALESGGSCPSLWLASRPRPTPHTPHPTPHPHPHTRTQTRRGLTHTHHHHPSGHLRGLRPGRHRLCDRVPDRQRQPLGVRRQGRHHQGRRQGEGRPFAMCIVLCIMLRPLLLLVGTAARGYASTEPLTMATGQTRPACPRLPLPPPCNPQPFPTPNLNSPRRWPTPAPCCSTSSGRAW